MSHRAADRFPTLINTQPKLGLEFGGSLRIVRPFGNHLLGGRPGTIQYSDFPSPAFFILHFSLALFPRDRLQRYSARSFLCDPS